MNPNTLARRRKIAGAALALVFVAGSAQADVVYDFTGSTVDIGPYLAEPVAFRLTLPDVSTLGSAGFPGITLDCTTLTACVNIGTVRFFNFSGMDGFQLNPSNQNAGFGYFFDAGAFSNNGVHASSSNPGSLTVSGVALAPVPEPASYALFAAGLLGLAFKKRRRLIG